MLVVIVYAFIRQQVIGAWSIADSHEEARSGTPCGRHMRGWISCPISRST
ncbi:MAG: hypothetical protein K9M84_09875 [Spirochaetia bacterium]|nr:hypothetical protein [Spirochaetia bacterium]